MRFFEKTLFFFRKNKYFQGSGGPSWEQKSIKNRSENEVKIGTPSRLHFVWISVDLGSQVGTKTRQDRPRQRKTREAKGREGKERGREGIAREGCGKVWKGTFVGRGGGVRQTLRGRPLSRSVRKLHHVHVHDLAETIPGHTTLPLRCMV